MIDEFLARLAVVGPIKSATRVNDFGRAKVRLRQPGAKVESLTFCKPSAEWVAKHTEAGGRSRGVHEPGMIASLLALKEMPGQAGGAFFDIGVLHGYVSLMAAALGGYETVVGFEMNPRAARLTGRSIGLNPKLEPMVSIVHAGMSDRSEPAVPCLYKGFGLRVAPDDAQRAALLADGYHPADIDLRHVDGYVAETGTIPRAMKIDVEGTQHTILRGATETLKAHRPVLLVEGDSPNAINYEGTAMDEIAEELARDYGYRIASLDHRRWDFEATAWDTDPSNWDPAQTQKDGLLVFLPS